MFLNLFSFLSFHKKSLSKKSRAKKTKNDDGDDNIKQVPDSHVFEEIKVSFSYLSGEKLSLNLNGSVSSSNSYVHNDKVLQHFL